MKSPLNRGGLRFYLVIIALLCGGLLFRTTSPRSILAGLPCLLLGVWLHTWAKGCLRQNRVVATIGPYRFVRHPFYLANALIDAGLVVMAGWWPLAVVLPLWWLAIYIPVIRGEERYLSQNFPDEYPDYKRRVPCLIPWRRPGRHPQAGTRQAGARRGLPLEQPQHRRRGRAASGGADPGLSAAVLRGPRSLWRRVALAQRRLEPDRR